MTHLGGNLKPLAHNAPFLERRQPLPALAQRSLTGLQGGEVKWRQVSLTGVKISAESRQASGARVGRALDPLVAFPSEAKASHYKLSVPLP